MCYSLIKRIREESRFFLSGRHGALPPTHSNAHTHRHIHTCVHRHTYLCTQWQWKCTTYVCSFFFKIWGEKVNVNRATWGDNYLSLLIIRYLMFHECVWSYYFTAACRDSTILSIMGFLFFFTCIVSFFWNGEGGYFLRGSVTMPQIETSSSVQTIVHFSQPGNHNVKVTLKREREKEHEVRRWLLLYDAWMDVRFLSASWWLKFLI